MFHPLVHARTGKRRALSLCKLPFHRHPLTCSDEDDEFEEFKEEGACDCARLPCARASSPLPSRPPPTLCASLFAEWGEDKKNFKAAAEDWANDWDDEDVDTDFDKVLRAELEAAKAAAAAAAAGAAGGGGAGSSSSSSSSAGK